MNANLTNSSSSQQSQALDAVGELKQNLATAQKNLDQNLQEIKKKAVQKIESDGEKSENKILERIDAEIKSA